MQQDGISMDKQIGRRGGLFSKLLLLAIALCCTAAAAYLYPSVSDWLSSDRSIDFSRLRTGKVYRGDLLRDVSVQGKIVAADQPTLVSPVQGVVTLLVKAGDLVREGQTMARIESPELQNLLEQERSVLLSMKSELERIEIANQQIDKQNQQEVALLSVKLRANDRALERAKSLHEEGLASSIDYQKAEDDVEVARLELTHAKEKSLLAKETMEFELRTKELELRRQELVVTDMERKNSELAVSSPVAGLVSGVEVRDKDTVQASQALFSVVDLSEFEVEVFIPENYADEIAPETRAVVQYEGENYEGIVKSLSPEVENSQVKGVVVFTGVAPSGLKQNQRVYTRLILDSRPDVLKLPRGPFLESMGGRQAYVVEGDVATLRSIETGAVSVTEIEILSGLIEGEEAILSDLTRFDGVDTILLRR